MEIYLFSEDFFPRAGEREKGWAWMTFPMIHLLGNAKTFPNPMNTQQK